MRDKNFQNEKVNFEILIYPFTLNNIPDIFKFEFDELRKLHTKCDIGEILNFLY